MKEWPSFLAHKKELGMICPSTWLSSLACPERSDKRFHRPEHICAHLLLSALTCFSFCFYHKMWSIRQSSYDISAIDFTFWEESLFFKILKIHLGNHCEALVAIMKSPQMFIAKCPVNHWAHLIVRVNIILQLHCWYGVTENGPTFSVFFNEHSTLQRKHLLHTPSLPNTHVWSRSHLSTHSRKTKIKGLPVKTMLSLRNVHLK